MITKRFASGFLLFKNLDQFNQRDIFEGSLIFGRAFFILDYIPPGELRCLGATPPTLPAPSRSWGRGGDVFVLPPHLIGIIALSSPNAFEKKQLFYLDASQTPKPWQ